MYKKLTTHELEPFEAMRKNFLILFVALSAIMLQTGCVSSRKAIPDATIPRADFRIRDPFVLAEDGIYYLYESKPWDGGRGVFVRMSTDLEHWTEKRQVMRVADDLPVRKVWAPEVHKYKDAYYLFVTLTMAQGSYSVAPIVAGREKFLAPRGTWIYKADSPTGPFVPVKNDPVPPKDWMTLDGTLWIEDGQPYMVFCHEWVQIVNGTIEMVELKPDLSDAVGTPKTLFAASDAPNAMPAPNASKVTDGPFLYRSPTSGNLYMLWSTFLNDSNGYTTLCARSASGKLAGPWVEHTPIYTHDGGHGMIFTTLEGKTMMAIHQPNAGPERLKLLKIHEEGNTLKVTE